MATVSKKVLITGIDSFTGRYLHKYLLNNGYEVDGTQYPSCDITNKRSILSKILQSQPDYIIHLAGVSYVEHENAIDFYSVNTFGVENLLLAAMQLKTLPKKIILASSATVYGKQDKNILDESMCPKPVNHYGISKYAMECITQTYFNKLPIIIVRPFNYTGQGQSEHFIIPKIMKHFWEKKKVIELGNLHVQREFNDVRDIVCMYERLLQSKKENLIVNLCTNRPIKLLSIIEKMKEISSHEIEVRVNEKFVRKDEIISLSGSTSKLKDIIKVSPKHNIDATLQDMYFERF